MRSLRISERQRPKHIRSDHGRAPFGRRQPAGADDPKPFAPEAIYELKIDTDGDHVADIAYRIRFASAGGNHQTATVRRVTGSEPTVVEPDGYRFFAGWRSDPSFFDTGGAINDLRFTGDDFFADKDICSIVLEIPNNALGSAPGVNLWHRTLGCLTSSATTTGSRRTTPTTVDR
jgi:hypothetical protein